MNEESDVLYVHELAKKLGRTESAIRSAVNRAADWLPPRMELGGRLAWRRSTVDRWLADREKVAAK
jgi:predicted DNA-binding transcriptional regulator AlpA